MVAKKIGTGSHCADFDEVYSREIDAINERRKQLGRPIIELLIVADLVRRIPRLFGKWLGGLAAAEQKPIYRKSSEAGLVGLALSGGGIRSASFSLGALQALDVDGVLKKVDLLSTVSGGGYIGTSMTAAMTGSDVGFPFPSELRSQEPKPLKHVRDHSNFLIPGGVVDVLASVVVYLRGIIMNITVLLPWLLLAAAFTIFLHPDSASLAKPSVIGNSLLWLLSPIVSTSQFGYFTITIILSVFLFLAFIAWGVLGYPLRRLFRKSETGSTWTKAFGLALVVVLISAFCEAQPYLLNGMFEKDRIPSLWAKIVNPIQYVAGALAGLGAFLGFFWRTFETWVKTATQDSRFRKRALAIAGKIGIYVASIVVPFVLWLVYLRLSYWGIFNSSATSSGATPPFAAPNWLVEFAKTIFSNENFIAAYRPISVGQQRLILAFYLFFAAIFLVLSWWLEPNSNSLHRLYRDRLSKAFLFDLSGLKSVFEENGAYGVTTALRAFFVRKPVSGDLPPLDNIRLSDLSLTKSPYLIINTALNIQGSKYVNRRGRNADFFLFSPRFIGSTATGYAKTKDMEAVDTDLDVATAMAISGAAASSNMGSNTIRPMTPTLTMLNIRLGFWLRNPNWRSIRLKPAWQLVEWLNLYFFAEMFGRLREDSWAVYLTDGGHIENLGIYELLKRECKLIIAVDAEADPQMNFSSFVKLQRHARMDLGIIIDLPWRRLRAVTLDTGKIIAETGGPAHAETRKGPHCVVGRIQYPAGSGYLVYVKASLTGDENDYIQDYKRRNDRFPQETTGDQFFSEEQFEVYRALGFHAMRSFLKGGEELPTLWDRRQETGPTPPMYARKSAADSRKTINEIRSLLNLPALPAGSVAAGARPKRARAARAVPR